MPIAIAKTIAESIDFLMDWHKMTDKKDFREVAELVNLLAQHAEPSLRCADYYDGMDDAVSRIEETYVQPWGPDFKFYRDAVKPMTGERAQFPATTQLRGGWEWI